MWPDPTVSHRLHLQSVVVEESTIPPDLTFAEWRSRRVAAPRPPSERWRRGLSRAVSVAARRTAD